ncbi:carotenoid oxygenase family protein [Kaistia dalseonensis]|uniref:Dioxygenase n=1 Tax=Kaistia dalseonensis TaxID=410840 RepID=A0ABU0HA53_9HYPH|nr:carotenoid oxygenase family protein [Kaistia dalseonensis]MCX5496249.1 carotenoid oxygenase family protein [Kaistia dalseonensis]MDQ0438867.1 carotenoid cleavage dioxygenase [Kaistia dalseonensis]
MTEFSWQLRTAPIDWVSDDPQLSGNFAPIGPEIAADDLEVTAGAIPPELSGVYMRNGPNPEFKPIAYTYPMDGDGMIHAVYFDNGRARYRNRFVHTRGLETERRAGRAVYGSVMRPFPVDPALVGPHGDPGPVKSGAYINILRHGDHLIALGEAQPSYEMTMELETIGEWRAGTDSVIELGAHNRRHPTTGDLFALAYSVFEPVVTFHHIDRAGRLKRSFPVTLSMPSMIHDFVLTERTIVLLVGPVVFDVEAPAAGKPFLQWRPELGTRIGLIPLDGTAPRWLDAEPFHVFHFANGFERGEEIVVDFVRHQSFGVRSGGGDRPPMLHRLVIRPGHSSVDETPLADFMTEFPRINDRHEALPSRFAYLPTLTETFGIDHPARAIFNALVKVDTETGATVRHDLGNRIAGEPVFIPKPHETREDAGYLAVYAYDPQTASSDLVLLDAEHPDSDPVAVIRMPQRVPQGLHGNWMARS